MAPECDPAWRPLIIDPLGEIIEMPPPTKCLKEVAAKRTKFRDAQKNGKGKDQKPDERHPPPSGKGKSHRGSGSGKESKKYN